MTNGDARMVGTRLIIDTDIGPDCDDAGALACAHALVNEGLCELIAVTHCTSNPYGAGCIDAINRWYGMGGIPVGTLKREGFLCLPEHMKYNRFIAENYPNRYPDGTGVPGAVDALRRALSAAEDASVTFCAIGPLVNLSDLLDSAPDAHSSLNGRDLVAKKARLLVDMGGGLEKTEWNFEMDPAAAMNVCTRWPTDIWFSVCEVGADIITGRDWNDHTACNPISDSYRLYSPGGRMSWDQTAVLSAVMGPEPYFSLSDAGDMVVEPDGSNRWSARPGGTRRILSKAAPNEVIERRINELMGCGCGKNAAI